MRCEPIPILSDNYCWLLGCEDTGAFAIVDPAEAGPVVGAVEARIAAGATPAMVLLTHHHDDHVAAATEVARRFSVPVLGARADRHRLPPLDRALEPGDEIRVGDASGTVIDTPGHTVGHVSFWFAEAGRPDRDPVLACGDTLFSLGCGRLLEGTPAMMFESLSRLRALDDRALVACGHEYTRSNARFAITVAPDDAALAARAREIDRLCESGAPTLPSRLGEEKRLNPFLRAPDAAALGALRAAKDRFRG